MARRYQTKFNAHTDTLTACFDTPEDLFVRLVETTTYIPLRILDPNEKEREKRRKNYNPIIEITPTLHLDFNRDKADSAPQELKAAMFFGDVFCGSWKFTNSKQYGKRAWFTASNFMLYHVIPSEDGLTPPATIIDLIELVAEHFNLIFHNITDLHIALDCNKNVERAVRSMLTDFERYDLYLSGKLILDPDEIFEDVFEMARRSRKRIYKPSLTIKNDNVRVQIYDKAFEQATQGYNKPYIEQVNGFKNIHRVEVRIRNKDFEKAMNRYIRLTEKERKKEYKKMGLEFKPFSMSDVNVLRMLENEHVLCSIWRMLTDQTIYFRDKAGNTITLYDIATA